MWEKEDAIDLIYRTGLIPIIRVDSSAIALRVADAFLDGGISIIEVTFSVPNAIDVVKELSGKLGDKVLLGTGTVLDGPTAERAIEAGADFIVSPIYSQELIQTSNRLNKPVFPGALTPTEITEAYNMGADAVKVFPAGNMGGAAYLKAVRAPLPHIPLIPTGGVNLDTAGPLLDAGAFALGVGGALTDKKAISEGHYDVITENVKKFLKIVKERRQ